MFLNQAIFLTKLGEAKSFSARFTRKLCTVCKIRFVFHGLVCSVKLSMDVFKKLGEQSNRLLDSITN